jgi:hypothetical protein
MAQTGIQRIDELLAGAAGATPLARGDPDTAAVGALQDLLVGHGARLPGILDPARGQFGPKTQAALSAFQTARLGRASGCLDSDTLRSLSRTPAQTPVAAQSYLALVLDIPWTGFARLVALTAQFEAAGKFTARNRNTDRAGLSFGVIQWAQRPGRLSGLLIAFERAQPARFIEVFGGGDRAVALGLLTHTAKPAGGVTPLGRTTDPAFDLVDDRWSTRFVEAGRNLLWQKTQMELATAAFQESCAVVRKCAPQAKSERAFAFLLDVANQHGNAGLRNICARCDGHPDEGEFLQAVQDESVRRLEMQFGDGSPQAVSTLRRHNDFRTSPLLSDSDFVTV